MRRVNLKTFIEEYKPKLPIGELCRIIGVKNLDGRVMADTKTQVDIDRHGKVLAVHRDVAVPPPRPLEPEPEEAEPAPPPNEEPVAELPPDEPVKEERSSTWGKPRRPEPSSDYSRINEPRVPPQLDPQLPKEFLDDDDEDEEPGDDGE